MQISLKGDLKALTKGFDDFKKRQVPFAAAQALTNVARHVADAETALLAKTFENPTPFTKMAFTVRGARKTGLTATVFAKDKQAEYLAPYLDGGLQALGAKKAILTPINITLNQYGNIPKGKLASLKGKSDFFVGPVKFKNGAVIYGLWQRSKVGERKGNRGRGTKGKLNTVAGNYTTLKLLIDFTKPKSVTKRLDYVQAAQRVVKATFRHEFEAAFAKAMSTAR
jgi:hypothetical protein